MWCRNHYVHFTTKKTEDQKIHIIYLVLEYQSVLLHTNSCYFKVSEDPAFGCLSFFKILYLFIWHREREHTQAGGAAEGEGEARCGARSQDPKIMTWVKGRCLTDWATQMPLGVSFNTEKNKYISVYSKKGIENWCYLVSVYTGLIYSAM